VDLSQMDAHLSAVLLKMFLRDLPTPLFPEDVTDLFAAVRGTCMGHTTGMRMMTAVSLVRRGRRPMQSGRARRSGSPRSRPLWSGCPPRTSLFWLM
jgi:hypothetical protein